MQNAWFLPLIICFKARKGRPPLSVELFAFSGNLKLCLVRTIKSYLQATKERRTKKSQKQLHLSRNVPRWKKFPVAGWIKSILGLSGIDKSAFTAFTRSASTSTGKVKGLFMVDILKRGSWSSKSTWQTHNHKFVSNESALFQDSIGLSLLCTENNGAL